MKEKIKVLVAKPGLDGHERGARVLTLGLRGEGFDVVYTGLRRTPEEIVERAIKEDVDVIASSILSGAHKEILPRVAALAKAKGLNVIQMAGGNIPDEDIPFLKENGIDVVFDQGATLKEIAAWIRENVKK